MRLQGLSQSLHGGRDDARRDVEELCGQLGNVSRDIQAISHRLCSFKIELLGLAAAAASLCEEMSALHSVTIDFSHADVPREVPAEVALGLFRVLQEALKNAVNHSGVREFRVAMRGSRHAIHLEVVDAGIGFDPEGPTARHGLGLIGMRERIGLIHGELVVESRRGTGTRIHVSVPLHYGNRLPADRVALTDPHLGSGAQLDELNA
jgi:signal transduction histidine kinase